MQDRGTDSWGATNGSETIKRLGPILDSFEVPAHWERGIFHTRAASVGAVTKENAHPFVIGNDEGRVVVGIHNGCISNYRALDEKYGRQCAVDSEHIFHHIVNNIPTTEIFGWGAVAWYDSDDFDHLQLVRFNMTDLSVALLESGEVVFASTQAAVEKACAISRAPIKSFYSLMGDRRYRIGADGCTEGPRMSFGGRSQSSYSSGSYSVGGRYVPWTGTPTAADYDDDEDIYGYGAQWRAAAAERRRLSGGGSTVSAGKFHPDKINGNVNPSNCPKCYTRGGVDKAHFLCEGCIEKFEKQMERMDVEDTLLMVGGEWQSVAEVMGLQVQKEAGPFIAAADGTITIPDVEFVVDSVDELYHYDESGFAIGDEDGGESSVYPGPMTFGEKLAMAMERKQV